MMPFLAGGRVPRQSRCSAGPSTAAAQTGVAVAWVTPYYRAGGQSMIMAVGNKNHCFGRRSDLGPYYHVPAVCELAPPRGPRDI